MPEVAAAELKRTKIITAIALFDILLALLFLLSVYLLIDDMRSHFPGFSQHRGDYFVFIAIFSFLAALQFLSAYGLFCLKPWSRMLRIVLAWIEIIAFPIGPLTSPLLLLYLYLPGTKVLFSGKKRDELSEEEAEAATKLWKSRNRKTTVLIISLLIPIALITFFIITDNLMRASDRSQTRKTMADMLLISSALESYAEDHHNYPNVKTINELASILEPIYVKQLPRRDHWNNEYRYVFYQESPDEQIYYLGSSGKDRIWEKKSLRDYPLKTTYSPYEDFDADIVFSSGSFIQSMEPRVN